MTELLREKIGDLSYSYHKAGYIEDDVRANTISRVPVYHLEDFECREVRIYLGGEIRTFAFNAGHVANRRESDVFIGTPTGRKRFSKINRLNKELNAEIKMDGSKTVMMGEHQSQGFIMESNGADDWIQTNVLSHNDIDYTLENEPDDSRFRVFLPMNGTADLIGMVTWLISDWWVPNPQHSVGMFRYDPALDEVEWSETYSGADYKLKFGNFNPKRLVYLEPIDMLVLLAKDTLFIDPSDGTVLGHCRIDNHPSHATYSESRNRIIVVGEPEFYNNPDIAEIDPETFEIEEDYVYDNPVRVQWHNGSSQYVMAGFCNSNGTVLLQVWEPDFSDPDEHSHLNLHRVEHISITPTGDGDGYGSERNIGLNISPDGSKIVVAYKDIYVFDSGYNLVNTIERDDEFTRDCKFVADNRLVVCGKNHFTVYDTNSWEVVQDTRPIVHLDAVTQSCDQV